MGLHALRLYGFVNLCHTSILYFTCYVLPAHLCLCTDSLSNYRRIKNYRGNQLFKELTIQKRVRFHSFIQTCLLQCMYTLYICTCTQIHRQYNIYSGCTAIRTEPCWLPPGLDFFETFHLALCAYRRKLSLCCCIQTNK